MNNWYMAVTLNSFHKEQQIQLRQMNINYKYAVKRNGENRLIILMKSTMKMPEVITFQGWRFGAHYQNMETCLG
jgi:hypothetical protein